MKTPLILVLGPTALLSSSAGQKTSPELRRSGSDRHRRQDEERHRTLQDLEGVITGQGGLEDGPRQEDRQQHSEKYGAHQQDSTLTFDGSGGATKSTTSSDAGPATLVGADAVWAKLLEARDHPPCSSPPCNEGRHVLEQWEDLGEKMSHVQGAVVVRRPDLIDVSSSTSLLAPASDLDFVRTLQSYFPLFESSLFSRMMLEEGHYDIKQLVVLRDFLDAVRDGNDLAGMFLYSNYAPTDDVLTHAEDWNRTIPTVMSMADVAFSRHGFLWSEKDFVAPSSCFSTVLAADGSPAATSPPKDAEHVEKVAVLTQNFGAEYYHYLVENMSRLAVVLDVLLENPDIKVAVHWARGEPYTKYMYQFLELLGIERERVLLRRQLRADLAILPATTACGKANEATIMMLRHTLLKALYPETGGVPPTLPRPVILLIVRTSKRGLGNNDDVRMALHQNFPSFDVVEFVGNGSIASQLEAFATASVVVGPHGAGLSNIVVSPLHTPVLEIGPINCPTCFVYLAIKLQHVYARHSGGTRWDDDCQSWYTPDIDELMNLVRDLFEAKSQVEAARRR